MDKLLNEQVVGQIKQAFAAITNPVQILFFGSKDNCEYCGETGQLVKEISEIDETIVTGVIYNPITHFRKSPSTLVKNSKAKIFVCSKFQVNSDVVADTHDAGYILYVYGVKTGRDVQRMLDLKADGIICNDPRFVRETIDLLTR